VERVVRAASLVLQQTPAHLLIVGDGIERAHLEQLCSGLGIGERSHFTGFVSIKEGLPELYQMSTVFVTASEIETQGLVLLEAAACGLPIVAVQATCLHEIVHEGENGYLLRSGDPIGMAKRICELLENPAHASQMGRNGRLIVESHAVERTVAAYEDLYSTAIQEARLKSSSTAARRDWAAYSDRSG
jgi:glycosyltransferase involved in cell wall biosynthesis